MNERVNLHEAGRAIESAGFHKDVKSVDTFDRGRQEVRQPRERRADADRDDRSSKRLPSREERRERLRRASDDAEPRQDRRRYEDEGDDYRAPKSENREARRPDADERRDDRPSRRELEEREAERVRRDPQGAGDDHSPEPDEEDVDDYERDDTDPDEREDERRDDADQDDADYDGQDDERQPREELFKVKVHGKEFEVTKDELVRGYQRGKDYQTKTQEHAERGRVFTQYHQQQANHFRNQIAQVNAIVDGVKTALVGDINSPQMQELKQRDPREWAVTRQLMQERIDQVDTFIANLKQTKERHEADNSKALAEQRSLAIQEELRLLLEHVPDWQQSDDPERKPAAQVRVGKYLVDSGFKPEEFSTLTDHRMLLVAWKAMEYDRLTKRRAREEPRREPRPVTRGPRPGKHASGQRPSSERSRDQRGYREDSRRLKQSGRMRDAGKLIERLL